MLLNEHSARALDSHRRERFAQERAGRRGRVRKSAAAVLVAGIILAACGLPLEDPAALNPSASKLIVDLAPVGSPNISEFRGYVFPEMFPLVAKQSLRIEGYEAPEMWPEAAKRDHVASATGPR